MPKKNPFKLDVVSVRLVKDAPIISEYPLTTPEAVVHALGEMLSEFDREVIAVVNLKSDFTPINIHFASLGIINEAISHPRELFKASILSNAAYMLLIHCHPSGQLLPSPPDILMTNRMINLCHLMGISLVDHIIVGGKNKYYFSFKERNLISQPEMTLKTDYKELEFETPLVAEKKR